MFPQNPCFLVDEQIINREQSAIDQHQYVDCEADPEFRLDCLKQTQKGKDQNQIVSQETEQLPYCVVPARVEQGMGEVERVSKKDTAKNDG